MTIDFCIAFIAPHLISCVVRQNICTQFGLLEQWGEVDEKKIINLNYNYSLYGTLEGLKSIALLQKWIKWSGDVAQMCKQYLCIRFRVSFGEQCTRNSAGGPLLCPLRNIDRICDVKSNEFIMIDANVLCAQWINDAINSEVSRCEMKSVCSVVGIAPNDFHRFNYASKWMKVLTGMNVRFCNVCPIK